MKYEDYERLIHGEGRSNRILDSRWLYEVPPGYTILGGLKSYCLNEVNEII